MHTIKSRPSFDVGALSLFKPRARAQSLQARPLPHLRKRQSRLVSPDPSVDDDLLRRLREAGL